MSLDPIISKSATELVKLIRDKKLSSVEVTTAFLNRIRQVNPKINAVVQLDEEAALNTAKQADKLLQSKGKENVGPLHGLPITIKDFIDVKGYHVTYGSKMYDNYKVERDGGCVKKLRDAGVVIMGLTNAPELGNAYESDNLIYGKTNNPYDYSKSSGGSSGGAAAILAAAGSPFDLGSDGGGSIRLPSHYCGIAGHKPTQGLVSLDGVSIPFFGAGWVSPFGTLGPMARYVEDLILTLPVIAGLDDYDRHVSPVPIQDPNSVDVRKLKVAYYTDDGVSTPTKDIQDVVKKVAQYFKSIGAEVVEDRPEGTERTFALHWEIFFLFGDGGRCAKESLPLPDNQLSALRKQFDQQATDFKIDMYELNSRLKEIAILRAKAYQFLKKYDLIICPPCATTAKPHGRCLTEVKDFSYTMLYNNTGQPGTVVRCGTSQSGLPIGVQLVSNLWRDHVSLAAARAVEKEFGGWQLPPEISQESGKKTEKMA